MSTVIATAPVRRRRGRLSLSARILIGGVLGVAMGLFVGEYARAFDWASADFG